MRFVEGDRREKDRMIWQNCGKPLDGRNPRQRFCGGPCRAQASRRRQAEAVRLPVVEAMTLPKRAEAAVEEARQTLRGWD